jgi:4-amino-4-deoxy-L-arabinose transferase-like glycosyltransferase
LTGVTGVGLAVRLVYVLGFQRDRAILGDPFFFHRGANLLVHGRGFIEPLLWTDLHQQLPSAKHPPLYLLFLAIPSSVGLDTPLAHMLWSALLGTATVVVTGLLGRRIAGDRAGVIAAAIVAVTPVVWAYDGQLLSETLAIFLTTLALLLAYRVLETFSLRRVAACAIVCGLAALTRGELILLVPALLWPAVFLADTSRSVGFRLQRVGIATVLAIVVVTPWAVYNLSRFEKPVFLSSQLGATLVAANCQDTYHGPQLGALTTTCMYGLRGKNDESEVDRILRHRARLFIQDHLSRVPVVVAAREGRVTGLFRPAQQIDIDVILEGRQRPLAIACLVNTYLIEIGAIAGLVVMVRRRRRVRLFPLLVPPLIAIVTVAATYGTNRFRAPAETALAVLAAVAIDAAWRAYRHRDDEERTVIASPA